MLDEQAENQRLRDEKARRLEIATTLDNALRNSKET
jgi:hypothetical protein